MVGSTFSDLFPHAITLGRPPSAELVLYGGAAAFTGIFKTGSINFS